MTANLIVEQLFNGLQFGMMLFLMAAGVTLVFGIMRVINLAHGSMFMLGGYSLVATSEVAHSYGLAVILALAATVAIGAVLEILVIRPLYSRGHLEQVLATFGLTLFFNELVQVIFGREPLYLSIPNFLDGAVEILPGVPYSTYRLAITGVSIVAGGLLYLVITRTRVGALIRAGSDKRDILEALGINIGLLYTIVFAMGAALAGLAGMMTGPLFSVESGIGDPILIVTLVVIVVGGMGSIRGALAGSLCVGIIDTFSRLLLPKILGIEMGSALAGMSIYILMAAILLYSRTGLFGSARG